jgi:hypothetical protein
MEEIHALRIGTDSRIENRRPRRHSPETLRRLREAIASGAAATPDARRADFFEIQSADQVFYIHVSPVTQKITLLATWSHEPELEVATSA